MNDEKILKSRAIENSGIHKKREDTKGIPASILNFSLMGNKYAIETRHILEVQHIKDITRIPGTPDFIEGVINMRGNIIPVLGTRKLFSLGSRGLTEQNRLIVLSDKTTTFGLICDSIEEINIADMSAIKEAPSNLADSLAKYTRGIINNNTLLLDGHKIITSPQISIQQ